MTNTQSVYYPSVVLSSVSYRNLQGLRFRHQFIFVCGFGLKTRYVHIQLFSTIQICRFVHCLLLNYWKNILVKMSACFIWVTFCWRKVSVLGIVCRWRPRWKKNGEKENKPHSRLVFVFSFLPMKWNCWGKKKNKKKTAATVEKKNKSRPKLREKRDVRRISEVLWQIVGVSSGNQRFLPACTGSRSEAGVCWWINRNTIYLLF